jgi:hypothetical protein
MCTCQILEEDANDQPRGPLKTHGVAIQFAQDESHAWRVQVIKENGPAWFEFKLAALRSVLADK